MARKKTTKPATSKWAFRVVAVGIFLAEVAVMRGAASPFRLPKDAIALAAICLAIGFVVFEAARRKTVSFPHGRLSAVLLALPLLLFVSALWSASPLRALESAGFSLIWVIGILWFATLDSRSRLRLATIAAAGVVVSAVVMVFQIGGSQIFNLGRGFARGRMSLTGLTGNPADLAMAAVLLLPLLLISKEGKQSPRFQISLVLGLSLATLLTRTLSGFGALAVLLVVWLVQQRSRALWTRAAIAGGLFLAIALASGLGTRLTQGYERVQEGDWYRLLSARGDGWSAASEMIRSHPISGVGGANYDFVYYPSRQAWFDRHGGVGKRRQLASHFGWAHSDPLQLTAELGTIGLLWLIVLLVALIGVRTRAGPVFALAAAAVTPFALLHYPTHLAVGLIPITIILGEIIGTTAKTETVAWNRARIPIAVILVALAIIGAGWQLRRAAANLWMGGVDTVLALSQRATPEIRVRNAASIESAVLLRIDQIPRYAPTLWRTVGRARLIRQDFPGAEAAFRLAYEGWPHEDADFYLGMALVSQGRRTEGLHHLGRVCRTNPTLVRLIQDQDLRRTVEDMLDTYRAE